MRQESSGIAFQTTELVNEVYLRLVDNNRIRWQDRVHFFAISAQLMRRILVDLARSRRYAKRGGEATRVTFDRALEAPEVAGHHHSVGAKLLKIWSGRRGSNPRRPAWEIDSTLKIKTIASMASM
jgi:hypothetical protein